MPEFEKEEQEIQKIHHLVERQAKKNPQRIAITYDKQHVSYGELNAKANQFARYLIQYQIKPGSIIPLVSNKSPQLLIAILGILKAGLAYCPINADNPSKYIETVIKEINAPWVITESNLKSPLTLEPTLFVTPLDGLNEQIKHFSKENLDNPISSSDLAYVIYTSGTTGKPKGGMIAHANLLPTYLSWKEAYELTDTDTHLQMAPVGFDVFAGDWIRALCSGARLVLCPKESLLSPEKLYQLIETEKITCAEFVPAILRQLMNFVQKNHTNLHQFRLLVCGSDQWTMAEYRSVKKLCHPKSRVISSYGLTETTIDSSFYEETPKDFQLDDRALVPIGKPFKHVQMVLLHEDQLIQPGEIGEIYIGGTGVGLGYLNQKELTASKFVFKTMFPGTIEKFYRTGDQGKMLPDGNFLFLGRNHEHVKINGKRVDLPSLETLIVQHPKIKFGLVIPVDKPDTHDVILKCFLQLKDESLTFEEIAEHIKSEYPCYYVPREFYQVDTIPLSANGKVDKRLSSQKISKRLEPKIIAPQDEIQSFLIGLWKNILNVEKLGINNSFHDLGGTSLLFAAMLTKVNKQFNFTISPSAELETIEDLAACIKQQAMRPATKLIPRFSVALPRRCSSQNRNNHSIPCFFSPLGSNALKSQRKNLLPVEARKPPSSLFFHSQLSTLPRVAFSSGATDMLKKLCTLTFRRGR